MCLCSYAPYHSLNTSIPHFRTQAFKNRDERYTLIWPRKAEFVRMAARFGATIVPFAAVGAEDGVNQASGCCYNIADAVIIMFEITVCKLCLSLPWVRKTV